MNTKKKIPNPRTPTSVRADIVTAILALGARQRARMIAGHHLYNKVDLRAWLDVAAERYLAAELEAERAASADAQLPMPTLQQEVSELPAAADKPKPAATAAGPKSPAAEDPVVAKRRAESDARAARRARAKARETNAGKPADKPADKLVLKSAPELVPKSAPGPAPELKPVWVSRSCRQLFDEARRLGIPDYVLYHEDLLRGIDDHVHHGHLLLDGSSRDANLLRTAQLIAEVRAAKERSEDPSPLWAPWVPADRKCS